jgi:hypothetical protein
VGERYPAAVFVHPAALADPALSLSFDLPLSLLFALLLLFALSLSFDPPLSLLFNPLSFGLPLSLSFNPTLWLFIPRSHCWPEVFSCSGRLGHSW